MKIDDVFWGFDCGEYSLFENNEGFALESRRDDDNDNNNAVAVNFCIKIRLLKNFDAKLSLWPRDEVTREYLGLNCFSRIH